MPSRSYSLKLDGALAIARSTTSGGKRTRPSFVVGRPCSSSRSRSFAPRISMPTSSRRRFASSTMELIRGGSRTWSRGRIGASVPCRSVERDGLPPAWDVDAEAERLDLRLDRELCLRVAVDQEDGAREALVARLLAGREVAQPIQQL